MEVVTVSIYVTPVDRLSPLQSCMVELLVISLLMPVPARRVWVGWESPIEGLEALLVQPRGAELVLLLASRSWMVGRSPQWPPLVRRDAEFFPAQELGLLSLWLALVHRVSWGHWWVGSLDSDHPPSQEGPLPGTPPHQRRRGSTLYLLPQLLHTLGKQARPPSSRQINLHHPMLEGPGICYCFLLGNFSNVPACID